MLLRPFAICVCVWVCICVCAIIVINGRELNFALEFVSVESLGTPRNAHEIDSGPSATALAAASAAEIEALVANFWPSSPRPEWEALPWLERPPVTAGALNRTLSLPASPEAWCPWAQAAAALDANETISIVVLGGSVTMGHACHNDKSLCRWSRHIEDWLHRVRPQWRFTLRNLAAGGMGSYEWANAPIPGPVDILIVDTNVNAFFFGNASLRANTDRLLWRLLHIRGGHSAGVGPPAILFLETFRLCGPVGCGACPTPANHLPHPPPGIGAPELHAKATWCPWFYDSAYVRVWAVVALPTLCPRDAVGAVESLVAREYGQPVASYRDIVWPERDNPPLDLALAWKAGPDTSGLHPDASTHELLADVVKHALWRLLLRWPSRPLPLAPEQKGDDSSKNGSHSPSPPPWALVKIPYGGTAQLRPSLRCASASLPAAPLSPDTIASSSCVGVPSAVTVGAEDGAAFEAAPFSRSSAGWSFSAEKPDKPRAWLGTIVSDDGGNEPLPWIAFPIVFRVPHRAGKLDPLTFFPQLEVTFLRSYEGFTGADVSINATGCDRLFMPSSPEGGVANSGHVAATRDPPLQGWWDQRVSTPFTMTWGAAVDTGVGGVGKYVDRLELPSHCAWMLRRDVPYLLNVTLRRRPGTTAARFKLLRISACGMVAYRDADCC